MDATRAACAMSCAVADREPSANRGIACARCQMSAFQTESSRQLVFVRWDTYRRTHTFWNWCIAIPVQIGKNTDLAETLMLHPVITVILFYCKMETFEQSEHNCVYFWARFFFFNVRKSKFRVNQPTDLFPFLAQLCISREKWHHNLSHCF